MTIHFRKLPNADERNSLGVISCVAASWVNVARAATNGAIPPTDAEVLALRQASGDISGGQDLPSISKGSLKRYGWTGTIDESWETIQTGLVSGDKAFVVLGYYRALPARLRNAGQADVFHAVAVLPGYPGSPVIVDSLQKPAPLYVSVTMAEVKAFCATGAFQSLGIGEYSQCGTVAVRSFAGIYTVYATDGHYRLNILPALTTFRSRVGKVEIHTDAAKRNPRYLAELLDTKRAGKWVNVKSGRLTYVPPKGA